MLHAGAVKAEEIYNHEEQPIRQFDFEERIAPDSVDIFAAFSRFDPDTCTPTGPIPSFEELEFIDGPEQGRVIDMGIIAIDEENCAIPNRILIYHADEDFLGREIITVKDPRTNIIIKTVFYSLDLYQYYFPDLLIEK
ncbi:MAG: hypothetical protein AAF213_06290 [Pseudomonadota bacterium]